MLNFKKYAIMADDFIGYRKMTCSLKTNVLPKSYVITYNPKLFQIEVKLILSAQIFLFSVDNRDNHLYRKQKKSDNCHVTALIHLKVMSCDKCLLILSLNWGKNIAHTCISCRHFEFGLVC